MDKIGRPPLDPDVLEDLDSHLYTIDSKYWKAIQDLQAGKSITLLAALVAHPPPPKRPRKLRKTLAGYATELFYAEADKYSDNDALLEHWLTGLEERTVQRVNEAVAYLEKRAFLGGLDHHGLTKSEMHEIVHEATREAMQSYLESPVAEIPLLADTTGIPKDDSLNVLPTAPIADADITAEIQRRARLLAEYKKATKTESNRQIYGAKNSPIHKPQFYEWIKGVLPASSATTTNFERFLREKRYPIRQ
jgi:hypothetical protein